MTGESFCLLLMTNQLHIDPVKDPEPCSLTENPETTWWYTPIPSVINTPQKPRSPQRKSVFIVTKQWCHMVSVFKIRMGWSWIHFVPTTRDGLWSIHLYCIHQIRSQGHALCKNTPLVEIGRAHPRKSDGNLRGSVATVQWKLIATDDSLLHCHHSPIEIWRGIHC